MAERLGISQPALSKQIQHLEQDLGARLFDRTHSPLTLTPAGEYFVSRARELVYREEQMRKEIARFRSGENGRLTVGITPFRSLYLMPELVTKLRSRFPGVQVVLKELTSAQLRKAATEGTLDLAVVNLPVDTAVLDVVALESDALVLAVPTALTQGLPAMENEDPAMLDLNQTEELPFVALSPGREMRQLLDDLCAVAGFAPNIAAEVMGVTSAWAMARAGVGATLLPLQFVRSQNFDRDLSLYMVKNSLHSRQPVVVTRKGQTLTPYAEFAIELLTGRG